MLTKCSWGRGVLAAVVLCFLLSGCGLQPCLHTTSGCDTNRTDRSEPCQEFGGPTTGCHASLISPLVR